MVDTLYSCFPYVGLSGQAVDEMLQRHVRESTKELVDLLDLLQTCILGHSHLRLLPEAIFGTSPQLLTAEAIIRSATLRRDRKCRPSNRRSSSHRNFVPQAHGPESDCSIRSAHIMQKVGGSLNNYLSAMRQNPMVKPGLSSGCPCG
ncbi:UNVERIFIED_CONTAM: hypothetical protein FKN15_031737 [Acipenser sinensis]